jgi:hypothetical protein
LTPWAVCRPAAALLIGVALPHVVDAVLRWTTTSGDIAPAWQQGAYWAAVGLPAAWLVAWVAGRPSWPCALWAGAGGLLALLAPFLAYGLPVGTAAIRVLGIHFVLLGIVFPAIVLLFARRA